MLEEFGPPEESESLSCTNLHTDDEDEEEELLLLHRGLPGLLRTKPLIVGAYLWTSAGAVAWIMVDWRALILQAQRKVPFRGLESQAGLRQTGNWLH